MNWGWQSTWFVIVWRKICIEQCSLPVASLNWTSKHQSRRIRFQVSLICAVALLKRLLKKSIILYLIKYSAAEIISNNRESIVGSFKLLKKRNNGFKDVFPASVHGKASTDNWWGAGAKIHIFVITDLKSNRFYIKLHIYFIISSVTYKM